MAAVYKSISKKQLERPVAEDDEDLDMEELLDEDLSDTDSDEEDDEEEENGGVSVRSDGTMPKTRVLMLTSRGVTHRYVLPQKKEEGNFLIWYKSPTSSFRHDRAASAHTQGE